MPDQQSTEEKLKQIQTLLGAKEYEKVIKASQEILDNDPTNKQALALLKEAHEAKTMALRQAQSLTSTSLSQPQVTIPQQKEIPIAVAEQKAPSPATSKTLSPSSQQTSAPEAKVEESQISSESSQPQKQPEKPWMSQKSFQETISKPAQPSISQPKPQSLEEIFSHSPSEKTPSQPSTAQKSATFDLKQSIPQQAQPGESKTTNKLSQVEKQNIIKVMIKIIIALVLIGGIYFTWRLYSSPNEPKMESETVPEKKPQEEEVSTEEKFVITPEDTPQTQPETEQKPPPSEPTESTQTEQKKKVRRAPAEGETKEDQPAGEQSPNEEVIQEMGTDTSQPEENV